MTTEIAPAASGRLSVANALSARVPRLIHHPLSVDCPASLTTGLQVSTLGEAAILTGALAVGLQAALDNVFTRRQALTA
jgi:hypothetical protein